MTDAERIEKLREALIQIHRDHNLVSIYETANRALAATAPKPPPCEWPDVLPPCPTRAQVGEARRRWRLFPKLLAAVKRSAVGHSRDCGCNVCGLIREAESEATS